MDEQAQDDGMGWEAQQENEERRRMEEEQALLDNDPGYHVWLDELEMVARTEREEYGGDGMDAVLDRSFTDEELRLWNLQRRIDAMGGF